MDIKSVSDNYHFFYDPYLYGYNEDDFFRTVSGTPTCVNGKIRIRDSKIGSLGTYMFGVYELKLTIPHAPKAGDSEIFGLYSMAKGNRDAAYFFISGTNFYVRSYSANSAVAESTTVTWDTLWTNTPTVFEVRWTIDKVEFWINGRKVAEHHDRYPRQTLVPLYFYVGNTTSHDNVILHYINLREVRKAVTDVLGDYLTSTSSTSSSTSSGRWRTAVHTPFRGSSRSI